VLKINSFFILIAVCNSLIIGMDSNATIARVTPQLAKANNLNYTHSIQTVLPTKPVYSIKSANNNYSLTKFDYLQKVAEREIWEKKQEVKRISDLIDDKYVKEGESWWIVRELAIALHVDGWLYTIPHTIQELKNIYRLEPGLWNSQRIHFLYQMNSRFYNHMNCLAEEKIAYYAVRAGGSIGRTLISGANIDSFFDEENLFGDLQKPFQKFVQFLVEKEFLRLNGLSEQGLGVRFYVLLNAYCNSRHDPKKLQALLNSSTFRKHEYATQRSLAKYINENEIDPKDWRSWLPGACCCNKAVFNGNE
jgi:hypothetical protein